jgi:hypothetical protein
LCLSASRLTTQRRHFFPLSWSTGGRGDTHSATSCTTDSIRTVPPRVYVLLHRGLCQLPYLANDEAGSGRKKGILLTSGTSGGRYVSRRRLLGPPVKPNRAEALYRVYIWTAPLGVALLHWVQAVVVLCCCNSWSGCIRRRSPRRLRRSYRPACPGQAVFAVPLACLAGAR